MGAIERQIMEDLDFSGIEEYLDQNQTPTPSSDLDFSGIDEFVPKEETEYDMAGDIERQLGLTLRAGAEGTAGALGIFSDPIASLINQALPEDKQLGMLHSTVSKLLTDAGVPEPETATERIVQQASQALVGAGGGIKTATKLGTDAVTTTGKEIAKSFTDKAAQQAGGAIGGGIGQKSVEEMGGGTGAQIAGALVGGLGGAGGVQAVKSKIQSKEQLKALMKTDPTNKEVAKFKIQGNNLIKDNVASEAIKQGFEERVISSVKSATPLDRKKMVQMVNTFKNGRKSATYAAKNRPTDVIGKSIDDRVNHLVKTNRKAGTEIETAAKGLKGTKVDSSDINSNFLDNLEEIGVRIGTDKDGKTIFSLKGADIEGDTASKSLLNKIFDRTVNSNTNDAYELHRLKRFIDTQVSYGKSKANPLSKASERVIKTLRKEINDKLGGISDTYKQANTKYGDTIQAIDDIQKAVGTSIDMNSPNAAKAFGTASRKVLSNYGSRVQMIDALDGVETVAKKYGMNVEDDIVNQVIFANEIDRMFGASASTSFKGQIEQAVSKGVDAARRNLVDTAVDLAKTGIEKTRGINEDNAIKAIETLLKETK